MTILSDLSIKELMRTENLVEGVSEDSALHCAFHFPPGKIYSPGTQEVIDWTDASEKRDFFCVDPGHLVWVRTLGRVNMPTNLCAFWWQTNALSRKGLMLVNMSMVEPGYRGCLSCLFVNFGKEPAVIHRNQPIAKLVFAKLDRAADSPYLKNPKDADYDAGLIDIMATGPHSFLQIAQLSAQFEKATNDFSVERSAAIQELRSSVASGIRTQGQLSEELRKKFIDEIEQDSKKVLRKTFGWAILAILVLGAILSVANSIKAYFTPDMKEEIAKAVSQEMSKHMTIVTVPVDSKDDNKDKPAK